MYQKGRINLQLQVLSATLFLRLEEAAQQNTIDRIYSIALKQLSTQQAIAFQPNFKPDRLATQNQSTFDLPFIRPSTAHPRSSCMCWQQIRPNSFKYHNNKELLQPDLILFPLQLMRSDFLYQDLEKGVFYLVNKHTGHKQPAHKDGSPLKTFKADITGQDYKVRKSIETKFSLPKTLILNKIDSKKNQLQKSISLKKKTIDDHSNSRIHDSDSPRKVQSKTEGQQDPKMRMKSVESQVNFVTGLQTNHEKDLIKSNSQMGNLLKSFSKMKEEKVYENHSIIKRNEGRVFKNTLINSKGFRQTQNIIYQPNGCPKILPTIANPSTGKIPLEAVTEQLSKERKLFLQFHPFFEQRQNKRLLQQQIERRKNFKKLQALFLQSAQKTTNKIYE